MEDAFDVCAEPTGVWLVVSTSRANDHARDRRDHPRLLQLLAQGGDWGSLVTSWLGVDFPCEFRAIHINMMGLRPYLGEGSAPLAADEAAWVAQARKRLPQEAAYQAIQGTKPQTLAYALTDSPLGLAAWIVEKFHGWSDPAADAPPFPVEPLVTNVMIYRLTGCLNSSIWLYTSPRRKSGSFHMPT